MSTYPKSHRNYYQSILASLLVSLSFICFAETVSAQSASNPSPKEILEQSTANIIKQLNAKRNQLKANPELVNKLVEETLLPHMDFITTSKLVMGKYWRRASKQQKLDFIHQFRSLLLRFYSSGLSGYLVDHDIDPDMFVFLPLRAAEGAKQVKVTSELHTPGGKIVIIRYSMHLGSKGWKVYDVSVDGISLVTTYRTSFASEIQQKGIDGLITSLENKNTTLLKNQQAKRTQ